MSNIGYRTIHVGFNNTVVIGKIVAIINSDSNPAKRLINEAKTGGKIIDATEGRRTRAILVTDSGHAVLSALMPETIASRIEEVSKS